MFKIKFRNKDAGFIFTKTCQSDEEENFRITIAHAQKHPKALNNGQASGNDQHKRNRGIFALNRTQLKLHKHTCKHNLSDTTVQTICFDQHRGV